MNIFLKDCHKETDIIIKISQSGVSKTAHDVSL